MLTPQQHKLFTFICDFYEARSVTPSYEEMRQHLKLKSKSGIHALVGKLRSRGFIKSLPNQARAIEILKPATLPAEVTKIPFYGEMTSVSSLNALAQPQKYIEVPPSLIPGSEREGFSLKNYCALQVAGDFLKDGAILNGDILIIKEDKVPFQDAIVFAVVNKEEVQIKRWNQEGNKVSLTPLNKYMVPQVFDASRVDIRGYLVASFRFHKIS